MRRLVAARELLDGELTDPRVLDGNLRDLARVNRRFGGAELSIRAVRALAAGHDVDDLRLLDVGTGAADIPLALVRARGPWRSASVTAVDSRAEILEAAGRVNRALAARGDITLSYADGRSLAFDDGAFDIAHASLVLHHLGDEDAVAFLGELARVASRGIVINDLQRGALNWLGAWLVLHAMTRNPFTLHDGPLSVRRAWTRDEVVALLNRAGLRPLQWFRGFAGHRWSVAALPR